LLRWPSSLSISGLVNCLRFLGRHVLPLLLTSLLPARHHLARRDELRLVLHAAVGRHERDEVLAEVADFSCDDAGLQPVVAVRLDFVIRLTKRPFDGIEFFYGLVESPAASVAEEASEAEAGAATEFFSSSFSALAVRRFSEADFSAMRLTAEKLFSVSRSVPSLSSKMRFPSSWQAVSATRIALTEVHDTSTPSLSSV